MRSLSGDPSVCAGPDPIARGRSWGDAPPAASAPPEPDESATARINLRLPEHLKAGIEQAAGRERMSVNTWLVRTAAAALAQDGRGRQSGGRIGQTYTGWVR